MVSMTDALGKMLRASLNDKRDVVTVAEDLQITQAYLRIQLIRYGDRLQVEYTCQYDRIKGAEREISVPKQPAVGCLP